MSIGASGRIVIEVEPEAKRLLYAALARDGLTLKDWFLRSAENYLSDVNQLSLAFSQSKITLSSDGASEQGKSVFSEGKV